MVLAPPACSRPVPGGMALVVRVTPNAAADRIVGVEVRDDGVTVLGIRVTAVPDKGRANKAVISLLAKKMGLPKSAITIEAGATARLKRLTLAGDYDTLATRLAGILSDLQ